MNSTEINTEWLLHITIEVDKASMSEIKQEINAELNDLAIGSTVYYKTKKHTYIGVKTDKGITITK